MRRIVRWLKQLLTGRKEEHRGLQANHVGTDWGDGPENEKKRWSFAKQRKSGADGGARSSGLDAVAPPAAVEWSRQVMRPREDARAREHRTAVVIQKTFRGYLARRALRALRSLVKIQALVRGYLVRKQAAMTLHRLQTLMRLQADSIAVKNASYRKSMEQEERIFARDVQLKPLATPVHRRMLSDSTDSNYERSPRIVEMDTCHLRSRSSRITSRYNPDHLPEYHRHAAPTPSCSPLPVGKQQQPARLSLRRSTRERDIGRGSKTAQSTPRFASHDSSSPAKSVEAAVRARASELLRDTTTNTSPLVDLPLPANLSGEGGVRAWALRVRSNALWADGVNATGFTIPPLVVPAPFARRLTIVFERFVGNSTAAFAAPRRYALAVPVAGLLAYDASAGPDVRVSVRLLRSSPRLHFGVLGAA